MAEKKRRTRAPVKRRYKVRLTAHPIPTTPTLTAPVDSIETVPTPTVATSTASTQTPVVKLAATTIPVTVYNLAQIKFEGIPHPTGRPRAEENMSAPSSNPPQPEGTPNALVFQVREDTPWPNTIPASMNLFEARADWPIPPYTITCSESRESRSSTRVAAIAHAMVIPKLQKNKTVKEKCTWGLHCPICEKEEEDTEKLEW